MTNIWPVEVIPSIVLSSGADLRIVVLLMTQNILVRLHVKVTLPPGNKTAVFGVNETVCIKNTKLTK